MLTQKTLNKTVGNTLTLKNVLRMKDMFLNLTNLNECVT